MFMYVFSIAMIVTSNVVYHIAQKSTPEKANPFAALLVTYLTASIVTAIALLVSRTDEGFFQSFEKLNWISLILGVSIVGLEFGFLMAYRSGWNISLGSLVANSAVALALIPIGILMYREGFGLSQIIGAALCIGGLVIINVK